MTSPHPKAVAIVFAASIDGLGARALEDGFSLLALTIDYGQRHRIEPEAAARVAAALGAERHVVLPLDLRQFGGSALAAPIDVPKDGVGEDVPVTYVPARNTIFLSLALGGARLSSYFLPPQRLRSRFFLSQHSSAIWAGRPGRRIAYGL